MFCPDLTWVGWHRATCAVFLLIVATAADAAIPGQREAEGWAGTDACARCHAAQHEAWRGSHHDLAMQPASETSVLGAFDGRHVRHHGIASKFFRRDGGYWIETDGPDGKLKAYPVAYAFGVYPLQQYLLALPGGRLQAFSIAWDSRPATSGGQRWFHLRGSSDCGGQVDADDHSMVNGGAAPSATPNTPVVQRCYETAQADARDPMHWTGSYYNWNSRCAECHSTNLSKRYDPNSGTYATTWSEINVGCEACHGPGARHMALADAGRLQDAPDAGLDVDLRDAGAWHFVADETIARRSSPAEKPRQVETCARCHARRTSLSEYRHGADLLDTHLPALLEVGLYYVDGQILEEVYVYGSFVQSKMYQAGVTCSNCHEPHGLALRAPGNAVCAQCHLPAAYDNTTHHHHVASSPGAACVNCHMPATTYMSVDPRRDHSLRIPRPDLSAITGTPNACNGCHDDRSFAWATDALENWGIRFADAGSHPARVLQRARQGDARAARALRAIAMDDDSPAIWRATAAAELGRFPSRQAVESAASLLTGDDAMLRLGAVRAIGFLPWQQRLQMLEPLLRDPATAIRIELARALADVPLARTEQSVAVALEALFDEYLQSLARHADMPESLSQRGDFLVARELYGLAENAYRGALESDPQHVPTLLNLADLYRVLERDGEARTVLGRAIASAPAQAAPHHALGLLETRADNQELGFRHLERAAALETQGIRYRYVYAIALHDTGETPAALEVLRSLLGAAPGNPHVLLALVNYSRSTGRIEDARRYADELRKLFPDDPAIRHLYESL